MTTTSLLERMAPTTGLLVTPTHGCGRKRSIVCCLETSAMGIIKVSNIQNAIDHCSHIYLCRFTCGTCLEHLNSSNDTPAPIQKVIDVRIHISKNFDVFLDRKVQPSRSVLDRIHKNNT